MDLKRIVIHSLEKKQGKSKAELFDSDFLNRVDKGTKALVENLNSSYIDDKRKHYGNFSKDDEPNTFKNQITDYFQHKNYNGDTFLQFSKKMMRKLEKEIQGVNFASGGYYIFTEYIAIKHYIGVFLVRDRNGHSFSKSKNKAKIDINETIYVDTKDLAMAFRVNVVGIDSDEVSDLTFTQLKQQEVSNYFKRWVGAEKVVSNSQYTGRLINIIKAIPIPKDEDGKQYNKEDFLESAFEYAKIDLDGKIIVSSLSKKLYGDENVISNYAEENDIELNEEFKYDKRKWNTLTLVSVNKSGIKLSVSRGDLDALVDIMEDKVVINSKEFAQALKEEKKFKYES